MGRPHLRLFRRLLSLAILLACLCYVGREEGLAFTDYTCDINYFQCYSGTFGDPNKTCVAAAESCMTSHPRYSLYTGPICEPSGSDINTTCLRGNIHMWDNSYPDLSPYFEGCMETSAENEDVDSMLCCKLTADLFSAEYCP